MTDEQPVNGGWGFDYSMHSIDVTAGAGMVRWVARDGVRVLQQCTGSMWANLVMEGGRTVSGDIVRVWEDVPVVAE